MENASTAVAAVLVFAGIAGLIIPVLPGLFLTVLGVFVWALGHSTVFAWSVFGVCLALALVGWLLQYLLPGKRLSREGVPTRSTIIGVVLGIIGFFVIPVVGLFIGFVLGVFLAEYLRMKDASHAWRTTKVASKAALLSVGIELAAACIIATVWVGSAIALSRNWVGA